jgi:cytochrome d ubiquinol oxidase subunit I
VALSFFSYHLMVAIGVFFAVLTLLASFLRWRGTLFEKRWLLWICVVAVIPAFVANEAGWAAAEVGRQPWIVYAPLVTDAGGAPVVDENGHYLFDETQGLRTTNGVSTVITGDQVLGSIIMFGAIYSLLFCVWVFVLHQKISHGPEPVNAETITGHSGGALEAATKWAGHRESLTENKE